MKAIEPTRRGQEKPNRWGAFLLEALVSSRGRVTAVPTVLCRVIRELVA
jgi:hypothetical protein